MRNITRREDLIAFQCEHGVRRDWHEPDEQDIDAWPAVGLNFDNACCDPTDFDVGYARRQDDGGIYDTVYRVLPIKPGAEHGVVLFHEGEPVAFVNLACLLAFATGWNGVE